MQRNEREMLLSLLQAVNIKTSTNNIHQKGSN